MSRDAAFVLAWGTFLLVFPFWDTVVLYSWLWFPSLVYLLYSFSRTVGFFPRGFTRVVALVSLVAVGYFFPARWLFLHQVVGPLPHQATMRELHHILVKSKFRFFIDDKYLDAHVTLPANPARLGEVLEAIRTQTGAQVGVVRFCGTGAFLLAWDAVDSVFVMTPDRTGLVNPHNTPLNPTAAKGAPAG